MSQDSCASIVDFEQIFFDLEVYIATILLITYSTELTRYSKHHIENKSGLSEIEIFWMKILSIIFLFFQILSLSLPERYAKMLNKNAEMATQK